MPKPITKNQLADFWSENYVSFRDWEGLPLGHCGICGNSGVIDTRGKVFTAAGVECGMRTYCICPNGQALKKHKALSSNG